MEFFSRNIRISEYSNIQISKFLMYIYITLDFPNFISNTYMYIYIIHWWETTYLVFKSSCKIYDFNILLVSVYSVYLWSSNDEQPRSKHSLVRINSPIVSHTCAHNPSLTVPAQHQLHDAYDTPARTHAQYPHVVPGTACEYLDIDGACVVVV